MCESPSSIFCVRVDVSERVYVLQAASLSYNKPYTLLKSDIHAKSVDFKQFVGQKVKEAVLGSCSQSAAASS